MRREPLGVVGAVTPWNYPMMMAIWKIGPALAAGNTLVLKPSDTTPASTVRMGELFAEILPPGVLNVVCGDRSTGAALASHPIPAMVAITGSTAAGRAVAAATAKNVTRAHLELGGNAPVVVFDDADVAAAAEAIAIAGFFNAGQDCTAATRVLASRAVADELAAALAEQAQAVRFSRDEEADSEDLFIPPINNADQLAKVSGLVDRLPSHARVLTGGSAADGAGYFYTPTVVAGVQQDDEIARNEIFGPVITVQTFADEAEALELANDAPYGLASSVFTTRPLAGDAHVAGARLRLRVDQRPHPAGGGDAARRVQGVRVRQGPLGVLAGGLHTDQARDERGGGRMTTVEVQGGPALPQERRLVTEIPGPVSREWTARRQAAVSSAVSVMMPVFAVAAGGGVVVDADGNSLIDFGSGIAVTTVGNAAPQVVAAVREQVERFTHTCFMVTPYEGYVEVCRAAQRADARATTTSARRCSTRAPRPSRTRSRSPGRPPAGRRWRRSTTPTTGGPT